MLNRRLSRWLAVLLLAISPAVAGQVLPVLLPCAIEMPWLATAQAGGHHGGGHHGGHTAPQQQAPTDGTCCTCIGCFATATLPTPPVPPVSAVAVDVPRHGDWPLIEAVQPRHPVIDRLPPSTAPPLA